MRFRYIIVGKIYVLFLILLIFFKNKESVNDLESDLIALVASVIGEAFKYPKILHPRFVKLIKAKNKA